MARLDINTDAFVKYTSKLEAISKKAIPTAVKNTLYDTVLDVKQVTMPASAASEFTQRRKNFFSANSKFIPAKGLDMKTMQASIGFYENKLSNASTNFAVKDLEQQEHGGVIDGKSYIPMSPSRSGGKGNVRPNARLRAIRKNKGIIVARNMSQGKTKEQKFINAVLKAGPGGFVLGSTKKGENILWRVNSLSSNLQTRDLDLTPLYDYKKGRSVHVEQTNFMKEASEKSAKKMPRFYLQHAQKLIKKYYGK